MDDNASVKAGEAMTTTSEPVGPNGSRSTRRQMLRATAASVGAIGLAKVVAAEPAAAANGQALSIGNGGSQSASAPTGVAVTGNSAGYGIGFTDNGADSVPLPAAIFGHARGWFTKNFSAGVCGVAVDDAFYGVYADSIRCGVYGRARGPADNGWPGVLGEGAGVGVEGYGGVTGVKGRGIGQGVLGEGVNVTSPALRAGGESGLLTLDAVQAAPPTSGTYRSGDILNAKNGTGLWVCIKSGTPGTWLQVAGPNTAGAYHALDGSRVYDSRSSGGKLSGGQTRQVAMPVSAVPNGATAVAFVLTALSTVGTGTLVAFSGQLANAPGIVSLSWFGAGQQISNSLVTPIGATRTVKIKATGGSAHILVDVVGYYR